MKDKEEDTVTALMMTMVIVALMSTVPLTVNATDTKGNCNDTVNITLAVKETNGTVIPFPSVCWSTIFCSTMFDISLSNISFNAIIPSPGNIEGHRTSFSCTKTLHLKPVDRESMRFGVGDKQTNWFICLHVDLDHVNEKVILKRLETRRKGGVAIANLAFDLLAFDPMCVMLDHPLWIGKNWTTTTKITGRLVAETGDVIPIDTIVVVSGAVTDAIENNISFEVAGELVACLIRYNIPIYYPTGYISRPRYISNPPVRLLNLTFDAIIPSPRDIEKLPVSAGSSGSHNELVFHSLETHIWVDPNVKGVSNFSVSRFIMPHWEWELRDSEIYWNTKMTGVWDNITKEPLMERLLIEMEPRVEIANLSFDPMFELFYFPLYVGKNWTTTTNVTGILVNETGIVIPIDSFAVVAGAVIEEVEVIDGKCRRTIFGLVIENNISFEVEGEPVSCLVRYWKKEPSILFPRDLCYAIILQKKGKRRRGHSI
jgi:hypothetical protein